MGNSIQIKVEGIDKILADFKRLSIELSELEKPMQEVGKVARAAVASYPPYTDSWKAGKTSFLKRRPGSKYVRTGALQKSWNGRIQKKGKAGPSYIVYQKTSMNPKERIDARDYTQYVQGDKQSSIHSGYWKTLDYIKEELQPIVAETFANHVKKIIKN